MLLRLIDKPNPQDENDAVEIILQTDNDTIAFTTEYFPSPLIGKFRETLDWYFREYPHMLNQKGDKGVPEEIAKLGREMGNRLLGNDQQLVKITKIVEDTGYQHVSVQIESLRTTFFQELWEILILPDGRHPLAILSKSFVRRFIGENHPGYDSEMYYDLVVESPTTPEQGALGEMTNPPQSQARTHTPLTIIHFLAQSSDSDMPSNGFNASIQSLRWNESVNYELSSKNDWSTLQQRVANKDRPVHIFHYEGPIILKDEMPYFCLGKNGSDIETTPVCKIAALLAEHKSALLCVDATVYRGQGNEISADLGFASIAQAASVAGIKNVLGLSYPADPWTKALCFQTVYDRIASGMALDDAISETRKFLQTQVENQNFKIKPVPFHSWPLLLHYGGQTVHFFNASQQPTEIPGSPIYDSVRKRLFGFRNELLPLEANNCEDSVLPHLVKSASCRTVLALTGRAGSGKSHLTHQASFYFSQHKTVEYAFYFNCKEDFYSRDDVIRMIAPVLDCSLDEKKAVVKKLAKIRCCFVFDDLNQKGLKHLPNTTDKKISALLQFLAKLTVQGHVIMVTGEPGNAQNCFRGVTYHEIPIPPLSESAQHVLATDMLRRYNVDATKQNSHYLKLLVKLGGHPFLIKKVMPGLVVESAKELLTQISDRFTATSEIVESFYDWQWTKLSTVWKKFLLLLIDSPGILLEMLMLVCDKWEGSDDSGGAPIRTEGRTDRGKRAFEPALKLFRQLGDREARFSDGIDQWDRAGFIVRHPYGKMIDSRCLSFLREKQSKEKSDNNDTLNLMVSQIVCEGIRLLSTHLQRQPNPIISHSLLMNRRLWAIHLEKLWFAQEYLGFIRSKAALDGLLQQARLGEDSAAWSLDLLKRSKNITGEKPSLEPAVAWLTLAVSALGKAEAQQEAVFEEPRSYWQTWLNQFDSEDDPKNVALLHHAALFLGILYQRQGDWKACRSVNEITYKFYCSQEDWPRVVQSLKSLAHCCFKLNEKEEGEAYEKRLLDSLPFDKFPEDFKTQLTMDVITARVARDDIEQAQILLDETKKTSTAERFKPMLDRLQTEIDNKKGARDT